MIWKTVVVCFGPSFSAVCRLPQYRQYADMLTHKGVSKSSETGPID